MLVCKFRLSVYALSNLVDFGFFCVVFDVFGFRKFTVFVLLGLLNGSISMLPSALLFLFYKAFFFPVFVYLDAADGLAGAVSRGHEDSNHHS